VQATSRSPETSLHVVGFPPMPTVPAMSLSDEVPDSVDGVGKTFYVEGYHYAQDRSNVYSYMDEEPAPAANGYQKF